MRNVNPSTPLIDGVAATATYSSRAIDIQNITRISMSAVVAGSTTPNMTVKVEVSNDKARSGQDIGNFTPTNWVDLSSSTLTFNANGDQTTGVLEVCFNWLRLTLTYTGGTGGTVSASIFGQGWA